eukprot:15273241-Alexandrium_andersonii.AAC.1
MSASLVGSEMCIRDRAKVGQESLGKGAVLLCLPPDFQLIECKSGDPPDRAIPDTIQESDNGGRSL